MKEQLNIEFISIDDQEPGEVSSNCNCNCAGGNCNCNCGGGNCNCNCC